MIILLKKVILYMYDLSILVPARQEEWLDRTLQDLLENIQGNTEILVGLDGYTPNPPLTHSDNRITIIYQPQSIGQRAITNKLAKLAQGKYLMKVDAHCAFDKGFDVKMLDAFKICGDNVTMVPVMRNLHVFDFICPNGHEYRHYQGRSDKYAKCDKCGADCIKDPVWIVKTSPQSTAFRFDKTMHFQYWRDWGNLQKGELTETMSIQGSCFMLTKERYLYLDICSEEFHSWGQQGVEVACKTWLSGGRVLVNRNTWYAHMFRTQGGDFSFPYDNPQSLVNENREKSRELFQQNKWDKAIRPFQWILDHFNPPDWAETKGMIYYTDGQLDEKIAKPVRDQLSQISQEDHIPIVTSSLKRKADFGGKNIYFPSLKRGYATMFKQILGALENSSADIIFFCEHDVLYHPSHFDFVPEDKNIFYFNNNVWKVDYYTKKALKVDKCEQLSGMCCYKDLALTFIREKYKQITEDGFDGHFEPRGIRGSWMSEQPNVDIRHDTNFTPNRWSKDQFKNQDNTLGWTEGECPEWAKNLF